MMRACSWISGLPTSPKRGVCRRLLTSRARSVLPRSGTSTARRMRAAEMRPATTFATEARRETTMSLIAELKRRKVFKVGAAYLVVAWLAVQAASIGFPAFDAPPWALRIFILVALLGFPAAVVLAWVFESTPGGVALDPP